MKFLQLRMLNWRSFAGEQEIKFSTDPERPVTLLFGPNGAGKTALLNAFTWALYGTFTDGFDRHESLVNFDAAAVDRFAEVWVELRLIHEDAEFCVRRTTDAQRQSTHEYDVTVTKNGERTIEDEIHLILPKPLKDHFFFPAEAFSTASILKGDAPGQGTSFDVGEAIRSLLSGDVYDRASDDLREAIAHKALKPPKNYRDETIERTQDEYERVNHWLSDCEQRRKDLPGILAKAREDAARTKREADRYNPEEMRLWQREHTRFTENVKAAKDAVAGSESLYVDLSRRLHLHFASEAVDEAIQRLDLAETAGLMPPRIDASILEKSLGLDRCVLCKERLNEVSREWIAKLKARAADAQIAIRGVETRTLLKQFLSLQSSEVTRIQEEVAELAINLSVDIPPQNAEIRVLKAVLQSCITIADRELTASQRALNEFNDTNTVDLPSDGRSPVEKALLAQRLVEELESESESIEGRHAELKRKTKDAFADYQSKAGKSDEHRIKTDAISILQEAKGYFDAARTGLEEFGRQDFEKAINTAYSELISKPFEIRVDNDFSLRVFQSGSKSEMPLSQSEKVLLLIAFLGAIARLAPHYEQIAKQKQQFQLAGDIETSRESGFPVVLDAPTSPLDDEYETEVVLALPKLLPQIIVPVSAQSVETWEQISGQIGSAYVMKLSSKATSDRKVRWRGRDYEYSDRDESAETARSRIYSLNSSQE